MCLFDDVNRIFAAHENTHGENRRATTRTQTNTMKKSYANQSSTKSNRLEGDHRRKNFEESQLSPRRENRILIAIVISHEILCRSQSLTVAVSFLQTLDLLGLANWAASTPLKDGKRLRTFLRSLDRNNSRKTARIAVIYIGQGQTEQVEIMHNTKGSVAYDRFLLGLGDVRDVKDLKQQGRYIGGLDPQVHSSTIYYENSHVEVAYHVLTSLPLKENDKQQIRRKRHIGNDTVHIVWCDNKKGL